MFFLGNDYNSAFFRKGKKKCYNHMLAKDAFKSFFAKLGDGSEVNASMLATAEEYVCAIYGLKKLKNVNKARFMMFRKRLYSSGIIDLSALPPCQSVLMLHLQRSSHVAEMWKGAKDAINPARNIEQRGWLPNGEISWTDEVYPSDLQDIFEDVEEYDDDDAENETDSDESDEEDEDDE